MKFYIGFGVLLVITCFTRAPLTQGYPLNEKSSDNLGHANGFLPRLQYPYEITSDYSPNEESDRLNHLMDSYFDLVGLRGNRMGPEGRYFNGDDMSLYPELPGGPGEFDTLMEDKDDIDEGIDETDDRKKRQQGWHIHYGKRSGTFQDDFQNSPSVYDEPNYTDDDDNDEDDQAKAFSKAAQDYAASRMLLSAMASKLRASGQELAPISAAGGLNNFGFEGNLSPEWDSDEMYPGSRFSKRQQGFHIQYGKRSQNGDSFASNLLL